MIFSTENIPKSLHIIYLFLWLPSWTPVNILKLNLLASWSSVSIKWEQKIYKNKNIFLPTYPNFFQEVTGNTHIIFLGLNMGYDIYIRHFQDSNLQSVPSRAILLGNSNGSATFLFWFTTTSFGAWLSVPKELFICHLRAFRFWVPLTWCQTSATLLHSNRFRNNEPIQLLFQH